MEIVAFFTSIDPSSPPSIDSSRYVNCREDRYKSYSSFHICHLQHRHPYSPRLTNHLHISCHQTWNRSATMQSRTDLTSISLDHMDWSWFVTLFAGNETRRVRENFRRVVRPISGGFRSADYSAFSRNCQCLAIFDSINSQCSPFCCHQSTFSCIGMMQLIQIELRILRYT